MEKKNKEAEEGGGGGRSGGDGGIMLCQAARGLITKQEKIMPGGRGEGGGRGAKVPKRQSSGTWLGTVGKTATIKRPYILSAASSFLFFFSLQSPPPPLSLSLSLSLRIRVIVPM